ncbi:MAG: hypothetical protein ACQES1_08600 [Bacteroidota bacterium]
MGKLNISLLISFLLVLSASAQQVPDKPSEPSGNGIEPEEVRYFTSEVFGDDVIINQDSELEKLIGMRMSILKKQKGFSGYRIRFFASVGRGARKAANNFRMDFKEEHPELEAYLVYDNPNWEIHAGDFRDRFEAKHYLKKLSEDYPKAFIVSSIVEFPELQP